MPSPCIYAGWLPSWKLSWLSVHLQGTFRTPPSPAQPHGLGGTKRIYGQSIESETELPNFPIYQKCLKLSKAPGMGGGLHELMK